MSYPHRASTLRALASLGAISFALSAAPSSRAAAPAVDRPNFVVIFCDDLGYGDVGCFGSKKHRTPNVDRMASEGIRLTSFYVTSGVCTPSRSSLQTGCYPRRVGMHQDSRHRCVLFPVGHQGLNPREVTVAEVLKARGYTTMCIGKWHLGDQPEFLPTRQGYDHYYGIPYSNDMGKPPLPLMRQERVIEAPADQNTLTLRYTREAVRFIEENRARPFFLYLPHNMPHNPVHASDAFRGKSANGRYGDAVEEIDASVGAILAAIKRSGLDERTLVLFTSDNGAAPRFGGSNAPLRGWKGTTWEGGQREPFVARWPGHIRAGSESSEIVSTLDFLPTFAKLAGAHFPSDRTIDGLDLWPVLSGEPGARSPREFFFYYQMDQLQAVRDRHWKLHLPLPAKKRNWGKPERDAPLQLFDLERDIAESRDVSAEHPAVVARLRAAAERAREELGDAGRRGKGQREPGFVEHPTPRRLEAAPASAR